MEGIKILSSLIKNKKNNHLEWPSIDIYHYDKKLFFVEQSECINIKKKIKIFPDKILELDGNMGKLKLLAAYFPRLQLTTQTVMTDTPLCGMKARAR